MKEDDGSDMRGRQEVLPLRKLSLVAALSQSVLDLASLRFLSFFFFFLLLLFLMALTWNWKFRVRRLELFNITMQAFVLGLTVWII